MNAFGRVKWDKMQKKKWTLIYFNNIIPYFIIAFYFEMQDHGQKKIQSFLPILSSNSSIYHLNFL